MQKTKPWILLFTLGLPVFAGAAATTPAPQVSRPNIIVMLADDLGYGDLGCYGATQIKTPNIDRLAAQGVRLMDAHATAAVCQPSRYAVLSGRYHWRAKNTGEGFYFQDDEVLMPAVFRDAGYATAALGKWHLGWNLPGKTTNQTWNRPITHGPNQAGFQYFFGQANGHEWPPLVWIENNAVYGHDPQDPLVISPVTPAYWPYAGNKAGSSAGATAAHAAYDVERLDLTLAERAGKWLEQKPKDQPFLLYMGMFAPHVPLMPAKEFRGTSQAGLYGDFVQQLDTAVGQVLDHLERLGLAENTLVILTSDNGGCYIDHAMAAGHRANGPLLGLKTDAWEGGHRVPFIARWPGRIPAGATSDALLSLSDIFPTVAAATDLKLPRGAAPDGLNQLPVLLHPTTPVPVRTEMIYTSASMPGVPAQALRSGDWVYLPAPSSMGRFGTFYMGPLGYTNSNYSADGKLLPDAPRTQLYNLRTDPAQRVNRVKDFPEIAARMDAALAEMLRQRHAR
jgi:arylsulfatase A-like enzyme